MISRMKALLLKSSEERTVGKYMLHGHWLCLGILNDRAPPRTVSRDNAVDVERVPKYTPLWLLAPLLQPALFCDTLT